MDYFDWMIKQAYNREKALEDELETIKEEAVPILKRFEWITDEFTGVTGGQCRICGGYKKNLGLHSGEFAGHKDDCTLNNLLQKLETE